MKSGQNINLLFICLILISGMLPAQEPQTTPAEEPPKIWVIVKNDGSQYVGTIIEQDAREVLIDTQEIGQVYIPRHEIKEIREVLPGEIRGTGEYMPAEVFSTRYFITTNGLPMKKGESYVIWSLLGPDFQFGVSDNVGLGVITSWIGTPLIGSAKFSIPINKDWNAGLGVLLGTGSWSWPGFAMALPYGVISYGDRVKNINLSLGYGGVRYKVDDYNFMTDRTTSRIEKEGNFLFSIAGVAKVGRTLSLVFDSFIVPRSGTYVESEYYEYWNDITGELFVGYRDVTKKRYSIALFIPGVRLQTNPRGAFQFGFAGVRFEGETIGVPFPMVQWFRKL
jgi:hypothetical protein